MIRSQAADYGFQLNEFDPYFNYRATQYLLDNGVNAYVHWHDDMSWYPQGRDVYSTAQVPLHFTDAILYKIFGGGTSLYDFTIIFPVIFGSLTTIVVFAAAKLVGAGFFLAIGFAAWGGIEFFIIPLGLFFIALPFLRKDHKFLLWAIPLFVAVTMVVAGGLFARPGPAFVFGIRGLVLIGPTIILVIT